MSDQQIGVGNDSGFALVEALVALIACSLVLAAYLAVVGHSARALQTSDERLIAAAFAQSKFDALGTTEKLEIGTTEGLFGDSHRWTLKVSDEGSSGSLKALRTDLIIRWNMASREQRVHYSTVKLSGAPEATDGQ